MMLRCPDLILCDRFLTAALRGKLSNSFRITSTLAEDQRAALEHLFFFNVNQHRVLPGIQRSIESYGVPEIVQREGTLNIRVGSLEGVQTLFAVSEFGPPLGVAVFVPLNDGRFVVLHLVVEPRLRSTTDLNTQVLLELLYEVRSAARRLGHIDRIELVYNQRHGIRLNTGEPALRAEGSTGRARDSATL